MLATTIILIVVVKLLLLLLSVGHQESRGFLIIIHVNSMLAAHSYLYRYQYYFFTYYHYCYDYLDYLYNQCYLFVALFLLPLPLLELSEEHPNRLSSRMELFHILTPN